MRWHLPRLIKCKNSMANLSIRKLDHDVYTQLQMRSLKHGISMEEEVRRIIILAVSAPELTVIFSMRLMYDVMLAL